MRGRRYLRRHYISTSYSYRNFVFLAIAYLFHSFIACISTLSLCDVYRLRGERERERENERVRRRVEIKSVGRPMTKPSIMIKFSVY